MMGLDEAIRHAEEVAKENESLGAMGRGNPDKYAPSPEQCFKCAEEHRQLAEWLKELKELREQKRPHGECNQCRYYEGVHYAQGHAPCSFWGIGGVLSSDYCSRFEKEGDEK